jgi:hypothetical protein
MDTPLIVIVVRAVQRVRTLLNSVAHTYEGSVKGSHSSALTYTTRMALNVSVPLKIRRTTTRTPTSSICKIWEHNSRLVFMRRTITGRQIFTRTHSKSQWEQRSRQVCGICRPACRPVNLITYLITSDWIGQIDYY